MMSHKASCFCGEVKFEVTSVKKIRDMLMKYKPGDKVEVQIVRGGETLTLTITLAKRSG